MEASSGGHNIPRIMTFRPTWDEFKDFNKFIQYVESQGAHKAGICKIIPPKEWVPRKEGYDNLELTIPAPIQQVVHGKQGLYTQYNVQKKPISVMDFKALANSDKFRPPRHTDYDDLERKYWKNITFINPIYGADVSGSLTDKTQEHWNIQKLGTILDCLGDDYGISIEGVNTAYLYFGMWKTTFAWHTEDMDLYSINYIHFGAAKRWYAIPPEHGRRLERLAAGFFPESNEQCPAFLRHKMTLISPMMLKKYSIPYDTITQNEREIIVTFPYGYHAGFNQGFNCAESTNFASLRWIDYGKHCLQCHCRKDSVKIDMGAFVKRFQPKLYNLWVTGQDNAPHPEDDKKKLYQTQAASSNIKTLQTPLKRQAYPVKESTTFMDRVSRKRHAEGQSTDNAEPKQKAEVKAEPKAGSSTSEKSEFLSDATTDVTTDHNSDSNSKPTQPAVRKKKKKKSKEHRANRKQDDESTADEISVEDSLLRIDASWAESLTPLWKFNPYSFEHEVKFNKKQSRIYPHCAVCSVLNNEQCQIVSENQMPKKTKIPKLSAVLLPNSCYMSQDNKEFYTTKVSAKPRLMLTCKHCKLAVHDTCYGVKMLPDGPENWICTRCTVITSNNTSNHPTNTSATVPYSSTVVPEISTSALKVLPECCLCCLRGGPLKPTDDGRWAHITCAVSNIEITFPSPNVKEPISLKLLDKQRATLKCSYCGVHSFRNGKDRFGFCVQCSVGSCNRSFHLTCARMAGLYIDIGMLPFKLSLSCNKHHPNKVKKREEEIERLPLKLTDSVYARYRNGRFYKARILSMQKVTYYMVIFDDNSTSRDLYPNDIINFEERDGKPPLGSFVKVKWTDGLIYNGHFQGSRDVELFTVEFEDMTSLQLEKEQVWSVNEKLPSCIQKKLSSATEMKDDVFYKTEKELMTDKRTRGVQVNYMYRFL